MSGRSQVMGWSWSVWGRRRHYVELAGRTACGRTWDAGYVGFPDDCARCRACQAAVRRRGLPTPVQDLVPRHPMCRCILEEIE